MQNKDDQKIIFLIQNAGGVVKQRLSKNVDYYVDDTSDKNINNSVIQKHNIKTIKTSEITSLDHLNKKRKSTEEDIQQFSKKVK